MRLRTGFLVVLMMLVGCSTLPSPKKVYRATYTYGVDVDVVRDAAIGLAAEIAEAAPLAVESTRETLRQGLAGEIEKQMRREFSEQVRLAATRDHSEGKRAVAERRAGVFTRS